MDLALAVALPAPFELVQIASERGPRTTAAAAFGARVDGEASPA